MKKKIYEHPAIMVVHVKAKHILAASLGNGDTPYVKFKDAITDDTDDGLDAD